MQKIKQIWLDLNSSLWFLPTVMVVGAIGLAFGLIEVEFQQKDELVKRWPHLFGAGAEGSRGMLSAIASSMITVTGVTFSITIVALALASSQYTPRILRNFMRNRTNQFVLGFFVGVFAYCLIVLRTIRGGGEVIFIPSLAIVVGIVLALASIGVLIVFIHHIASSIQADHIISAATRETISGMRKLFPDELGDAREEEFQQSLGHEAGHAIPSKKTGFVQQANVDGLLRFAQEHDGVVRMECGVGEFIVERARLVSLVSEKSPGEEAIAALNRCYEIGDSRTIAQDPTFGIRQLVDIALKALSPGINDTTTAVSCVEHLGAVLTMVTPRKMSTQTRSDENTLRVIGREPTFAYLVAEAFDQIRGSAKGNPAVMITMLRMLGTIASQTKSVARKQTLREQVGLLSEVAERSLDFEYERAKVRDWVARAHEAISATD